MKRRTRIVYTDAQKGQMWDRRRQGDAMHEIASTNSSHIATLVERHTRYVMLARIDGKDSATVVAVLSKRDGPVSPLAVEAEQGCQGAERKAQKDARL